MKKHPDTRSAVGARIEEARKAMGMNRTQCAARIGIGPQTLSKIEKGETFPHAQTLQWIAKALNVSETWLREGESPIAPPQPAAASWSELPNMVPRAVFECLHRIATERPELLPLTQDETLKLIRYCHFFPKKATAPDLEVELTTLRMLRDLHNEAYRSLLTSIYRLPQHAAARAALCAAQGQPLCPETTSGVL